MSLIPSPTPRLAQRLLGAWLIVRGLQMLVPAFNRTMAVHLVPVLGIAAGVLLLLDRDQAVRVVGKEH